MNANGNRTAPPSLVAMRYGLLFLTCASALFYFQWRIGVMNPSFRVYSWLVYGAELLGFVRALLFLRSALRMPAAVAPPPLDETVSVDVFIPTYDEPVEIIRRTALAVQAMRYPHETWLLDDGESEAVRALASEIGCRYVRRTQHANAKAGNCNHALPLARGEFVAIFDADHVADPSFLDRTLGYFQDPRVAFVQTPQEFFNAEAFEHLNPERAGSNDTSLYHRVVQRCRHAANATLFMGTCGILRRSALDAIGGFATGTVGEEVHTSLRLHAAGWRSAFHPEILSAGMSPLDGAGNYGQRLRWSEDSVQLLLRCNALTYPGLSGSQRIAYLMHSISNLEGWRHLVIYALPVAMLITGVVPLQTDTVSFLAHFLPYLVFTNLTFMEMARGHWRPDESVVYNLARCTVAPIATFTGPHDHPWVVTPKATGRRRSSPANGFTIAVFAASTGAIVFGWVQAATHRSSLTPGALAVVSAWAAYNALAAVRLLLLERRCVRERRATTRFAECLPATLASTGDPLQTFAVDVTSACADGFTVRTRGAAPCPPAGAYTGVLDAGGVHFSFDILLRDGGRGGAVRWPEAGARAAFDLLLHQRAIRGFALADRGDCGGAFR